MDASTTAEDNESINHRPRGDRARSIIQVVRQYSTRKRRYITNKEGARGRGY